jgi:hypothetical protein
MSTKKESVKNSRYGWGFEVVLVIACWLTPLTVQPVQGQPGLEAYERGALSQVEEYLSGNAADPVEAEFLRAALTTDAENAVEIYRRIVLQHPESPFSKRALHRIYEYYYALGIYGKAEEFEKALNGYAPPSRRLRSPEQTPPPPAHLPGESSTSNANAGGKPAEAPTLKSIVFSLQVGAFASRSNAEKLRNELTKSGYSVEILDASRTKNRLYTVRVTGYPDEYAARSTAEELQRKFGLNPILIKEER